MILSRRRLLVGGTAAALLAPNAPASAVVQERFHTLMRRVMGMTWVGTFRAKSDAFVGDEFVAGIGMKFALADDWSYRGIMMEEVKLESGSFIGRYEISGECWTIGDEAGVSIYKMKLVKSDTLPSPYSWGTSTADMRFLNDTARPGNFSLQGTMTNDSDGTKGRITLSNTN